jgi:hypothetical protein
MRKFILLAALLAWPLLSHSADITGTWHVKVVLGDQGGTPTFVLKQDGEKLTGTYSGALGDAEIKGTVKGDEVKLEFDVEGIPIRYEGKLNADGTKMEGTCDYGGLASGTFTATKVAEPLADH